MKTSQVAHPNAGTLLTLLKDRLPDWYSRSSDILHEVLSDIALNILGTTDGVEAVVAMAERAQAHERRKAEEAEAAAQYRTALTTAKNAASHYLTVYKQQRKAEIEWMKERAWCEKARANDAKAVQRFLDKHPQDALREGWEPLKPEHHPTGLADWASAVGNKELDHVYKAAYKLLNENNAERLDAERSK